MEFKHQSTKDFFLIVQKSFIISQTKQIHEKIGSGEVPEGLDVNDMNLKMTVITKETHKKTGKPIEVERILEWNPSKDEHFKLLARTLLNIESSPYFVQWVF